MARSKKRAPKAGSSRRKKTGKLQITSAAAAKTSGPTHCCLVCYKDQHLSSFPNVGSTGNHTHKNNTHENNSCRQCLNRYIVNQIESGEDEIKCSECAEHLTYDQVKAIISKTSLIKYDKVLTKVCAESDPDFRYCLFEKCKSGQIHVGGAEQPLFNCGACKKQHCANCEVPWHEDETCDQYQARHDNEIVQTALVLSKISKRCPGDCGARIERNGGCPHMHCIKCSLDFCWNCLGDFQHLATQGACIPLPAARADSPSDEIKYRQTERAARKEARKVEDDMSEALIIVTTKNCPRCKYPIEKDGGCDHMTCSNCLTQFCYECLNNYATILKYDNRRHKKTCIYHPSHKDRQSFPTKTDADEDDDDDESATATGSRARAVDNDDMESDEEVDEELDNNERAEMLRDIARTRAAAPKKSVAKKKKAAAAASKSATFTTRRALRSNTLVIGTLERRTDTARTRALDRAVRSRGI